MAALGMIGIIGEGWVGQAQEKLFPDAIVYDEPKLQELYRSDVGKAIRAGRAAIGACGVSFVCVPTPNHDKGTLDTSIVEEVVDWCDSEVICIRSTVNPGDTDRLKEKTGKRIVFQPEYLGETTAHPLLDPNSRPFMILGGAPEDTRKVIEAYHQAYNANVSIRQTTALEAEVIKLSENRAIAFKVLQAQELYDACEAAGVDYYTVRDAVYGDDPRFNRWFTFVYPKARGANSKCIPKDVYAWAAWADDSELTDALLKYNERLIDD